MFFDNVMYMFFAMFLYNESVIISNLRFFFNEIHVKYKVSHLNIF